MTVGKRIVLGFSCLIVLTVAIGLIAVVRMLGVRGGAMRLDDAYVPEVAVSNEIERSMMSTMYANRGFSYTEDEAYYREGKESANAVLQALDSARELAESQDLPGMKKTEPGLRKSSVEYFSLADRTYELINNLKDYRGRMDTQAASFVENANEMLASQDSKLQEDITDRVGKVELVKSILELGGEARVANFKAQATGDMNISREAVTHLEEALKKLGELEKMTKLPEDLELIDELDKSINRYSEAISAFIQEETKGENADSAIKGTLQQAMDSSAAVFTRAVNTFHDGQVDKLENDIKERVLKLKWTNNAIDLGNAARVNNFKAQSLRDTSFMVTAISQIGEMDQYFSELSEITRDPEDVALLRSTDEASEEYRKAMEQFLAAYNELESLNKQRNAIAETALAGAREMAGKGMEETANIAENSAVNMQNALVVISIGLVLAVGIGVILAYFIVKSITRPLSISISNLSNAAIETQGASGQVSSASQILAEGASEQAASIEETSSSMEEMTSMVARNAELARRTNEQSKKAHSAADAGVTSMGELRGVADKVTDSAQEMETAMKAIKQSSDSISKIIKTIDEIAFQTNILALNAAVEAARAGEAGAGFAVVADEVRSLAKRAAEAARETASLIQDSMERSDWGVRVNETVSQNLKEVIIKADQVEEGLVNIKNIVVNVSGAMEELEASVTEQQDGITQINTAINQVNEVTQSNAASAEEAASAAEEMNAQSVSLMEIVDVLNLMISGIKKENTAQPVHHDNPVTRTNGKGGPRYIKQLKMDDWAVPARRSN